MLHLVRTPEPAPLPADGWTILVAYCPAEPTDRRYRAEYWAGDLHLLCSEQLAEGYGSSARAAIEALTFPVEMAS